VANLSWYLQRLGWIDVVDILLVAAVFFAVLYLARGTRAVPLLRGVVFLIIAVSLLSSILRLRAFGWLGGNILPALLVAIPVVFQPELRRALERLGRAGAVLGRTTGARADLELTLNSIVEASRTLTERGLGALIVLERETGLQEFVDNGVLIDAVISAELLVTVFDPHTTLHDGAIIVRQGRAIAAGCVLPLSTAFLADRQLGLRHRAAIGVTEDTDAIAIVVSEERATISVTQNGRIIPNLDPARLEGVLRALYQPALERTLPRWMPWFRRAAGRRREGNAR
jgi:diadenylate cyclase